MKFKSEENKAFLKYRPDIDGLRAIAVLSVVIYHAFPSVLPGGFSGVDIFFVISGYLISGILYKGHREGDFSFAAFYTRRVRRIFPTLITLMLLCFLAGYRLLLKNEFQELGKQIAAGMLFLQNFVFWQESGYFDRAAELKPLLHLWSLAVEEQFYIFFPLLLILLHKRIQTLVPVIWMLLIASFILNIVISKQDSVSDFFLAPYRAWEFFGGSLLAWWHYDRNHEEDVPKYQNLIASAGMLLLLVGITVLHQGDVYPGWRALFPVVGAMLLIEGGKRSWVNHKILSHPGMVWIGLISYPLYVFHWPALSFMKIVQGGALDCKMTFFALGIDLLLTLVTYYLIERKIRFSSSRWTVPGLTILFIAVGIAGYLCFKGVLVPRSSSLGFDEVVRASEDNDYFSGYASAFVKNYYSLHKAGENAGKTLFVGDSHMEQCAPRILYLLRSGKAGDRGAVFLTQGGSLPIPGVYKTQKEEGKAFTLEILQLGLSPNVDRVVIAANWFSYFNKGGNSYQINGHTLLSPEGRNEAFSSLAAMISLLRNQGRKVYLVLNFPTSKKIDPLAMVHRNLIGNFSTREFHFYVSDFLNAKGLSSFTQEELMKTLEMVALDSGAEVIRPADALQKDGEFFWHQGLLPYYHDGSHLTATFVRDHASFLDKVIDNQ